MATQRHAVAFVTSAVICLIGLMLVIISMSKLRLHPAEPTLNFLPDTLLVIFGGINCVLLAFIIPFTKNIGNPGPLFVLLSLATAVLSGCVVFRTGVCMFQTQFCYPTHYSYWSMLFSGPIIFVFGEIIGTLVYFHNALHHSDPQYSAL